MKSTVRARYSFEAALASLCGFLTVPALFWRDWIGAITGFDPTITTARLSGRSSRGCSSSACR